MKIIDLVHRWTGGLIGLVLALLGLTGAILVNQNAWLTPQGVGSRQIQDVVPPSAIAAKVTADPSALPNYILFASSDFGLHRVNYGDGSGRYLDVSGATVAHWADQWERPEIWLFDLHRHLLMGSTGETAAGLVALIGLGFVVTGAILWWQRRRSFAPRLWPNRLSRPAIVRHHRDLGIILAPLLVLSLLTGAMLALPPVASLLLTPWSSPEVIEATKAKPGYKGGPFSARIDWAAVFTTAKHQFPDAEIRLLSLPRKQGDLITLRIKQLDEWLPNGRTTLWFAPEDGHLIETRNALTMPNGARIFDKVYPLHAAKVGGLVYRLIMTFSGLGLVILGTLSVWTFWFRRQARYRP